MYVHFMILITFVTIFLLILLIKKLSRRSCYSLGELIVSWKNEIGISGIVSKWVLTVNVDGQKYVSENANEVNDGDVVVMKVTDLPFKEEYDYNLSYVRIGLTKLLTLQEGQHSNDNTKFLSLEDVKSSLTYGPWTVTDRCSSRGKIIEERTETLGDNVTTEEQDSSTDCCYQTDWVGNRCDSDGKIRQTREAAGNCDDLSTERALDCCYQTDWVGNRCETDGKIRQTREVAGNCDDLSTERALDCCYKHNWSAYGECKDGWAYSSRDLVGSCSGVAPHKKIRCDEMEFVSETWPFQCGDVDGVEKRCSLPNWTGYTKCNRYDKTGEAYCERRNPYSWDQKTNLSEYNSLGGMEEIFELPS